ncbi:disease resistance-like protein DSC1 [Rosa rugosa]|uniref:disease resistance-like protein DSC1 n=1 Tax=Rosa rugosa TaxID=74645 RepID=UPI002B40D84A|nr:disease resistance-like protein DSC1 [Rosa rugosa]XP_062025660.1 disease resistance-like protein DSC1 [Rosa rugosa]
MQQTYLDGLSQKVLVEKALINIDENKCIWMHDLMEEMGKEIIRQESPGEPGKRSRLWFHEDVYDVLTENTGTNKVKGIIVKLPRPIEISLNAKCFKKMKSLQLFININASFSGEVRYLPNQLRFLDWPGCPLQSLPSNFNPKNLVSFNMPGSQISRLGGGFKSFHRLKSMNLEGCHSLTEVPNFSGMFPSLETLCLSYCMSLVELHPSVGSLEKLVDINLAGCYSLTMFPRIDNSTSLRSIDLRGCTSLKHFPEIEEKVESLTTLILTKSGIKELPSSINNLISLEVLHVGFCSSLAQIPQSIYDLQQLQTFCLQNGPKFVTLTNTMNSGVLPTNPNVADDKYGSTPESNDETSLRLPNLRSFIAGDCNLSDTDFLVSLDCVSTLERLDLSGNIFESLPLCFTKFASLTYLDLDGCKRLREIPELPPNVESLHARNCVSLKRIANLSNILEQKGSKMINHMNLTKCWRLRDRLAQDVKKMKRTLLINEVTLFSLCLSSLQSEFQVVFPASDVPEWFSCQMDFTAGFPFYEFSFDIVPHLQLENTGLAICVALEKPQANYRYQCDFEVHFSFNHHRPWPDRVLGEIDATEPAHVFMYYYPFSKIPPFLRLIPPPVTFRVTIVCRLADDGDDPPIKSCGVHLVMPPNEDVSIKISKSQKLPPEETLDLKTRRTDKVEDDYKLSEDDEDDEEPL